MESASRALAAADASVASEPLRCQSDTWQRQNECITICPWQSYLIQWRGLAHVVEVLRLLRGGSSRT